MTYDNIENIEKESKPYWVKRDYSIEVLVHVWRRDTLTGENCTIVERCASVVIESGDGKLILMDEDDCIIRQYESTEWRQYTVYRDTGDRL